MTKKIYYLSTCSTCKRIMKELNIDDSFEQQDIKFTPLTEDQMLFLKEKTGSYESLFSKRSRQYRALGLHEQNLSEEDYKKYILQEYTFLKRPVIIIGDQVFVGNSKKVIAEVEKCLRGGE